MWCIICGFEIPEPPVFGYARLKGVYTEVGPDEKKRELGVTFTICNECSTGIKEKVRAGESGAKKRTKDLADVDKQDYIDPSPLFKSGG